MLTPKFSLSQDGDFLYINIKAPHIKLSESECYINDDEFYFFSQPYYLRLHLPGRIHENHLTTSQYDADSGELTIRVAKETKGETFDGLDMLTKLLTPKKPVPPPADIEVVGNVTTVGCENQNENVSDGDDNFEDDTEFDWFIEQEVNEIDSHLSINSPSYGFASRKSNILNDLLVGHPDMIDLKDPDHVLSHHRKLLREQQEKDHFSCEHYLADLFDDDLIQEIVSSDYADLTGKVGEKTILSEKETEKLLQLPRREYIVADTEVRSNYLGLVDLMFGYAYNYRFTQGEKNVESDWTVCKLSATLSWLDSFENVKDVLISCARRSLTFPLYRNWKLFQRVLSDVKTIFQVGKSQILKCLLGIHCILAESEARYPLNDLYITDYCVWIQSADSKRIESIAKALGEVKISKSDLGLSLDEMESDARKLIEEKSDDEGSKGHDSEVDKLATAMSDVVKVTDADVSDSDDSSDSDDDSDNDDGDDSSSSSASGSDFEDGQKDVDLKKENNFENAIE